MLTIVLWLYVGLWYGVCERIRAASASRSVHSDCFEFHTHVQALVEAASRTLFASGYGNQTRRTVQAHVVLVILHGALEKSFAAFARKYTVMEAGNFIAAYRTGAGEKKYDVFPNTIIHCDFVRCV